MIAGTFIGGCGGGGGSSGPPTPPPEPPEPPSETGIRFIRVLDAGFDRNFTARFLSVKDPERFSNGVAAADYDGDDDVDLYVVGGRTQPNHLYQNQGDGTYVEVAASVGLDVTHWGSGPTFGDGDGDGDLDLFVGSGDGDPVYLFENRLDAADAPLGCLRGRDARFRNLDHFGEHGVRRVLRLRRRRRPRPVLSPIGAPTGNSAKTPRRCGGTTAISRSPVPSIETGIAPAIIKGGKDWSFTRTLSDHRQRRRR